MFGEHGEYHQNDFVLGCAIFKETALAALGPKPLGPGVFTDDGCSEVSCDDTDLMSLVAGAGLQIERLDKRVIHRDLKDMKD